MGFVGHEKWFTDTPGVPDWGFLTEPGTLLAITAAVLVAVVWRLVALRAPAPSMRLADNPVGIALAILQGVLGVWLISGVRIRPAAGVLVLAGPLGMLVYGPVAILERADLLGIALFLAVLPPGRDRYGAAEPERPRVLWSVFYLRMLVGLSLLVVAFTEKLIDPHLALEFLDRYPVLNVARSLGLPVSDLMFVRIAGGIEVLFGLLLISGAAPQIAVVLTGIPFNATLFFFGASELIGHLPVYGAMLALLVYGSEPALAPLVPVLDPWRAERSARRMGGMAHSGPSPGTAPLI